jgi:hypothetical protein
METPSRPRPHLINVPAPERENGPAVEQPAEQPADQPVAKAEIKDLRFY